MKADLDRLDSDSGAFEAAPTRLHAYEAEQHLEHDGKCDQPACWSLVRP